MQPIQDGIPCKLITPQVSCRFIFFSNQGDKCVKPNALTTPVREPTKIA